MLARSGRLPAPRRGPTTARAATAQRLISIRPFNLPTDKRLDSARGLQIPDFRYRCAILGDMAGDATWVSAVPPLAGALLGGLAAVAAQMVAQSRQSKLAKSNWERDRIDELREQRMDTYIGLLGQLREIDHHHTALIEWDKAGRSGEAPIKPTLDGSITDRVNAFASKEIRAALWKALPADRYFRQLLSAGATADGAPAGSARQNGSPANEAYFKFRSAHRDIVDLIRTAINFPDLADKDREVLVLLARGINEEAMASEFNVSVSDVRYRIHGMLARLSGVTRKQAVAAAHEAGIGG